MRALGCACRGPAPPSARARTASFGLRLLAGQGEIDLFQARAPDDEPFELAVLRERLRGELVEDARGLGGLEHDLAPVLAVADLGGGPRSGELGRSADGDDAPLPQNRDPFRELLRLVEVVRREQDRLAQPAERPDRLPRLPAGPRIEARGGLVEEDQLGVADQREAEIEPAPLSAGEPTHTLVSLLPQPDELDHLVHRPWPLVVAGEEVEHLRHRERLVHGGGLEHDADPLAPVAAGLRRVDPEHLDGAAVATAIALADLDRSRLAGDGGAQQAEHLSAGDLELDPAQRLDGDVRLAQVADGDCRHSGRSIATIPAGGKAGSAPPVRAAAILPQSGWWPTTTTICPRSPAAARTSSGLAPRARRSSGSASRPAGLASSAAVSLARRSGLVSTASGRTPSAASRRASSRAAARPSCVSGLSSSGSPEAASACRTRYSCTA